MSADSPKGSWIPSFVADCNAGKEILTNLKSATTIALTTPPTPLNDAHQGGYFFAVVKTPANADGAAA